MEEINDFTKENVNLIYKFIGLEITRNCNLQCKHCMRGDPQDKKITPEIIEKTISQIKAVEKIYFTGGEPFLEPELIDYTIDTMIKYETLTNNGISAITNGTILNEDIAKSFMKHSDYMAKHFKNDSTQYLLPEIIISEDPFHEVDIDKAYDFYKNICGNKVNVFKQSEVSESHKIIDFTLTYAGRAKNLTKEYICHCHSSLHQIEFEVFKSGWFAVKCPLDIAPNGNVCIDAQDSYAVIDDSSIGNVMQEPLSAIIHKWNSKCKMTCEDMHEKMVATDVLINDPDQLKRIYKSGVKETDKVRSRIIILMYDKLQKYRENIDKNLQIKDFKFNEQSYPTFSLEEIELGIDTSLNILSNGKWQPYITIDEAEEIYNTLVQLQRHRVGNFFSDIASIFSMKENNF